MGRGVGVGYEICLDTRNTMIGGGHPVYTSFLQFPFQAISFIFVTFQISIRNVLVCDGYMRLGRNCLPLFMDMQFLSDINFKSYSLLYGYKMVFNCWWIEPS